MEEIRECVVCGTEFVAKQYKSNTCCIKCWKINRRQQLARYRQTEQGRLREKKQTKAYKEQQKRIAHQQDRTVWVKDYGDRQRVELVEQYARVNVAEILGGMKL